MKTYVLLWLDLAEFFYLEWPMFQTKFVEELKTHILCSVTFFSENHTVYEITWKIMVQLERPQVTI
jgi:hypothetical protein